MSETKTGLAEFRQQVRMAAVQVAGLRADELAQALAYEVEPLSGIPASEAEVSYQAVVDADPTVRVYNVVVRRRARRKGASGGLERWLRVAYAFAVLVLLAMACDGIWIARRRAALEKTVGERRPLQAELERLQVETRTAHASAEAMRVRREAAIRAQDEAAFMRRVHADLLEEVAAACGEQAVVTSIAPAERAGALTVKGVGATAEAVADVMRLLTARLASKGWQLMPGMLSSSATGATVAFWFDVARKGK